MYRCVAFVAVYEINNRAKWKQQGGTEPFVPLQEELKREKIIRYIRRMYAGGERFKVEQIVNKMEDQTTIGVTVTKPTIVKGLNDLKVEGIINQIETGEYQLLPTQVFIHSLHAAIEAMNPRPPPSIEEVMLFIARNFSEGDKFSLYDVIYDDDGHQRRQRYLSADVKQAVRLLKNKNQKILRFVPADKPHKGLV